MSILFRTFDQKTCECRRYPLSSEPRNLLEYVPSSHCRCKQKQNASGNIAILFIIVLPFLFVLKMTFCLYIKNSFRVHSVTLFRPV